jgi:uncharacterized repeat protein (TIGR04138 family)
MEPEGMLSKLERLIAADPRYRMESYVFVINALEFTMARLGRRGHVTGAELLNGVREFAQDRFGLMTKTVFEYWGINKTEDFGEIVFNMVNAGILGKNEHDSKEDFKDVYDFDEVFNKRYDWNIEEVP